MVANEIVCSSAGGIKFYESSNKVILSEGDSDGLIYPKYFKKVVQLRPFCTCSWYSLLIIDNLCLSYSLVNLYYVMSCNGNVIESRNMWCGYALYCMAWRKVNNCTILYNVQPHHVLVFYKSMTLTDKQHEVLAILIK